MKFISTRCSNVNRAHENDGNEVKSKHPKKEKTLGKHIYLSDVDSLCVDDDVSFDRNIKKLSSELLKTNPSSDVLYALMQQTFANRRSLILKSELSFSGICEKYPLLRKPKHVCEWNLYYNYIVFRFL